MDFKESDDAAGEVELSAEDLTLDADSLEFEENFADDESLTELEQLAKKAKTLSGGRFSLKARRAIEEHLEQRRLRKEMDYFFDDDFVTDGSELPKSDSTS